MPLLIISGIPACGKTHFGNWLEMEHGYLHVDMESWWGNRFHRAWESFESRIRVRSLVELIKEQNPNAVFTWGFPPVDNCFLIIREFAAAGVTPWWFFADESIARAKFIERATGHVAAFAAQLKAITLRSDTIADLYSGRGLCTLQSDGTRMSPQLIAQKLGLL